MPTTDVTNTLVANISSAEQSTSNVDINRSTGNPSFACNVGQFTSYLALGIGVTYTVQLPLNVLTAVTQVYVKNVDPTNSFTLKWTPNGGASTNIIVLNAGDQIILWCNPGGSTTPGITDLKFVTGAICLIEYFVGG